MSDEFKPGDYRICEQPKGFWIEQCEMLKSTTGPFLGWTPLDKSGRDASYSGDTYIYRSFDEAVKAVKGNFPEFKTIYHKIP